MALIIEDGSLVTGAVSYVTETELDDHAVAVGMALSGDKSQLLLRASIFMETIHFSGTKLTSTQRMQWPRTGVKLDGFAVAVNEIPQLVKNLQIELALSIDRGVDPSSDPEMKASRVKVGQIEESFNSTGFIDKVMNKTIRIMIQKLGGGTYGGVSFQVCRG